MGSAAVIALAEPVDAVNKVRQRATQLLTEAGLDSSQPSTLHCTLLRFATSGLDLSVLSRAAGASDLRTWTSVNEVVVSRELQYPNLVSETLGHVYLSRRGIGVSDRW